MMALSKEDIEDIKIGRAFEVMVASEGWKHYERIIKKHIETQTARALQPFVVKQENKASHQVLFGALDQLLTAEGDKGAIMAFTLAVSLPSASISNMIELLRKNVGADTEEQD